MRYDIKHLIIIQASLFNRKQKNLSTPEIPEIEKNLFELEKNLFKPKNYYDHDDIEYKGIRDVAKIMINQ